MLFRTRYYLFKESKNILEFREKKLFLFLESTFLLLFGTILLLANSYSYSCPSKDKAYLIITLAGVILTYSGLINFLNQGKIILDNKSKKIIYLGGMKKLIFIKYILRFDEISHIYIQERSGRHSLVYWDDIFLEIKSKSNIKIDSSGNDSYSTMLVRKISEVLGCEVYFFSE